MNLRLRVPNTKVDRARVEPSIPLVLGTFVVDVTSVFVLGKAFGVEYTEITATSDNLDAFGSSWVISILVGFAFVGFSEELMTRGCSSAATPGPR
ncbi:hypothetical protein [Ilumatobacter nonamiensis]|uniref:hypothetical protein n=1 Tax=Ilumatobacter nonamiensis TaxID=467093 RepID=UPI00058FD942|nr:hypothetical protein [Ilumatobacter nonamiensis]